MWGSGVTAPRFPKLRTLWKQEATFISQKFYVILWNGNDTPIPISWEYRWAQSRSGGSGEENKREKLVTEIQSLQFRASSYISNKSTN